MSTQYEKLGIPQAIQINGAKYTFKEYQLKSDMY